MAPPRKKQQKEPVPTPGIITITESELEHATLRRIPMADILAQHRRRYVMRTSIGDVVLRHISQLDVERAALEVFATEGYELKANRLLMLAGKVEHGGSLDAEEMTEYAGLEADLAPSTKIFVRYCFVAPLITSAEEYDALISELDVKERSELEALLIDLSRAKPAGKVQSALPTLSAAYHIPLAKDLTGENMTAQQAAVLVDELKRK